MTLHATLNPKSFLKSPGQELSEYIVYSSGEAIFLKFRSQGGVHSTFTYVLSKKITWCEFMVADIHRLDSVLSNLKNPN